jgi:hypothetical protein
MQFTSVMEWLCQSLTDDQRKQRAYRPAKDSVALARKGLKSLGIEEGNMAARISNQSFHL